MTDRAIWGGKATGLAKIMGAALTLPETACIACQNVPHLSDNDALDLALGTLPDSIAASLPDPGLVVRSSSTHEDGATASGAGLYKTVFGVTSVDLLKRAINDCWKSADIQSSKHPGSMGVVVQPLIPCEISGVAFSKDPMGMTPGICIEASWGNCSAVVDGRTDHDRYVVDGHKVTHTHGRKNVYDMVIGTQTHSFETPDDLCQIPVLKNEEARKIASLVKTMADVMKTPVDVEWGICNDIVYLFQCRAITTI